MDKKEAEEILEYWIERGKITVNPQTGCMSSYSGGLVIESRRNTGEVIKELEKIVGRRQ